MHLLKVLAITSLFLVGPSLSQNTSQDGSCGNGVQCPEGQCCSKWGYCGTTADYCNGGEDGNSGQGHDNGNGNGAGGDGSGEDTNGVTTTTVVVETATPSPEANQPPAHSDGTGASHTDTSEPTSTVNPGGVVPPLVPGGEHPPGTDHPVTADPGATEHPSDHNPDATAQPSDHNPEATAQPSDHNPEATSQATDHNPPATAEPTAQPTNPNPSGDNANAGQPGNQQTPEDRSQPQATPASSNEHNSGNLNSFSTATIAGLLLIVPFFF
ncbi:hypothetical protein K493DRAFT_312331 [Basidiobolus meristosporus CBS 931.73]|uniref:Chitin-binding type-1 domain-containing protein n=1 Tax=Basidiobolus meristosporus CBS 931.73 TaxID=1314790 RepID=A0A1Y1YUK6_9FUNG|nr:hypothetical protein K493DRAFT_312331 [Basidiobolus meristosporus CBS 931.73]|eukprot:ORY01718.1 hypothetical protein K493DRAFT_312331 [Basidiobolus meristosporus CBS 931.73]